MKEGAHTHHDHGRNTVLLAVIGGLVLAVSSGAVAEMVTAAVRLMVIALLVLAGLAMATGTIAVIVARQRDERQQPWLSVSGSPPVARHPATAVSSGELTELRAEVAALRRQLEQVVPADGGYHQHLHFHGADPAAITEALRQAGSDAR